MKYIYLVLLFAIIRFIYYLLNVFYGFYLQKLWKSYHKINNTYALSYNENIVNYFQKAHIKPHTFSFMERLGYGYVHPASANYYDNIFFPNEEIFGWVNESFTIARGYYKNRMFESFNPMYWIRLIIFLPKNIISYLGLNTDTIFTKIFQIIFWIIDSIIIVVYQDEITTFIKNLFS